MKRASLRWGCIGLCLLGTEGILAEVIRVPQATGGVTDYAVQRRGPWLPLTSRPAIRSEDVELVAMDGAGDTGARLTRWVVVRREEAEAAGDDGVILGARFGARSVGRVPGVDWAVVLEAADAGDSVLTLQRRLERVLGPDQAWPLLEHVRVARVLPNDPYLTRQWTLNNTGQTRGTVGADARVFEAWEAGYTGEGVLVSVVDDGFELKHTDLGAAFRTDLGYDYRDGDANPAAEGLDGFGEDGRPRADAHGTAVAGIIGAIANNAFGIAGIAHGARIVPVRALQRNMTDLQEASALGHNQGLVAVCNNSWGPDDNGRAIVSPGVLAEAARESGVREGRGGRGIIYVWAAGNGAEQEDDANYDGYANSIHAIAVGALTDRGIRCTYSEKGACLAVSAPSGYDSVRKPGTWTTDLLGNRGYNGTGTADDLSDNRFTASFNGTSAAAPVASAVVALMLQANPGLGWRDVKEVLMRSAAMTDPTNPGWFTNAAGFRFNHEYGAGAVHAGAAVRLAKGWTNLGPVRRLVVGKTTRDLVSIPDGDPSGVRHVFRVEDPAFRVEQVRLRVDITHPARGELEVELVSPTGTVSRLWSPHSDSTDDLRHRFMSVFHWGEAAVGDWEVRVVDYVRDQSGYIGALELELFGTRPDPEVRLGLVAAGTGGWELVLTGEAGAKGVVQRSGDLTNWTEVASVTLGGTGGRVSLEPAGAEAQWYRWVGMD